MAPDMHEVLARLETKLDQLIQDVTEAPRDGKRGGLLFRTGDLERRVADLEQTLEQDASRQMNWRHALGLTLAGGFVSQALSWVKEHIR